MSRRETGDQPPARNRSLSVSMASVVTPSHSRSEEEAAGDHHCCWQAKLESGCFHEADWEMVASQARTVRTSQRRNLGGTVAPPSLLDNHAVPSSLLTICQCFVSIFLWFCTDSHSLAGTCSVLVASSAVVVAFDSSSHKHDGSHSGRRTRPTGFGILPVDVLVNSARTPRPTTLGLGASIVVVVALLPVVSEFGRWGRVVALARRRRQQ